VAAQHKPDYDQRLLEVGDEALWIWSHALTAGEHIGIELPTSILPRADEVIE